MRTACLVALLSIYTGPLRAQAVGDNPQAQELFDQARAQIVAGDYADACTKLERSLALDPQLGALLHLAYCYEKVGRLADAWNRFQDARLLAAERSQQGQPDARETIAQRRAAALEPRISLVALTFAQRDLSGLSIEHDGAPVPPDRWTRTLAVAPGTHRWVVSAAEKQSWEHEYVIDAEPLRVSINVPALAPVMAEPEPVSSTAPKPPFAPPPLVRDSGPDVQRIVAYSLGGAGLVAAGFATGFFIAAQSASHEQDPIYRACDPPNPECARRNNELEDTIQDNAARARVAFVISGSLLVGGIVLWFTAPEREERPIAMGAGPDAAWISVQGRL